MIPPCLEGLEYLLLLLQARRTSSSASSSSSSGQEEGDAIFRSLFLGLHSALIAMHEGPTTALLPPPPLLSLSIPFLL